MLYREKSQDLLIKNFIKLLKNIEYMNHDIVLKKTNKDDSLRIKIEGRTAAFYTKQNKKEEQIKGYFMSKKHGSKDDRVFIISQNKDPSTIELIDIAQFLNSFIKDDDLTSESLSEIERFCFSRI